MFLPANPDTFSYQYAVSGITGYADFKISACMAWPAYAPRRRAAAIALYPRPSSTLLYVAFSVSGFPNLLPHLFAHILRAMANYNQVQYVRLRNLGASASTLSEDHAVDFEESSTERHGMRIPRFRQIGSKKLLLLLSLLLNIIWGLKLFFLRPSNRILTYCEYL